MSPPRYISTHSWFGAVPRLVVATDTILPSVVTGGAPRRIELWRRQVR
ncbi:hypothetical protein [Arthrobacter sp. ZGTC131]|nr:hypothetical protein [Arthrobacter sp. ZGTC131]